jgi:hypothetical protein
MGRKLLGEPQHFDQFVPPREAVPAAYPWPEGHVDREIAGVDDPQEGLQRRRLGAPFIGAQGGMGSFRPPREFAQADANLLSRATEKLSSHPRSVPLGVFPHASSPGIPSDTSIALGS